MNKVFADIAWDDYLYWQINDKSKLKKINKLIKSIERDGYSNGLGKPEPLKHQFSGYWSRRIDSEHRLVYKVDTENIYIVSCKDHY